MATNDPTEYQKALKGAPYPADREKLVQVARKNKADRDVVDKISHIPDKQYETPADVQKAVFGSD
ncbi:DUF2795 domain-containing protein [Streptomyces caatingaensis]|uniref:DUF2795 domain-containing protein n=1 Tax=Streptomyces caatingaensis TaxID=1678637 RepID=A0A0K9XN31_9ACTN|nr:DUF2795 domain-containing protein [Streptomyces caatingaensis]KNB54112.1 hypothetical protein AC230_06210 [Streptomyces caatingaensis]